MFSADPRTRDVKSLESEVEAALNPAEADGEFRDSRECAALLLIAGALLLSPPSPKPKKS
jgi:tellurite resistance protein